MDDKEDTTEGQVCRKFTIINKIGEGGYGNVYAVEKSGEFGKDLHKVYALKTIKKSRLRKKPKDIEYAQTERYIMSNITHPFIVSLKYAFQSTSALFYVMEYVPGGEIFTRLGRVGTFTEQSAKFYTSEILLALDFLHSQSIIYRDLKPDNILIETDGHIKLADFGLCKILQVKGWSSSCSDTSPEEDEGSCESHHGSRAWKDSSSELRLSTNGTIECSTTRSCCGTLVYMAPEVVDKQAYGRSADFWSLGVVVYDMLVGSPPFHVEKMSRKNRKNCTDRNATRYNILHCNYRLPEDISEEAKSFISSLLQLDVTRRLGGMSANADEIKNHTFLHDVSWCDVLQKKLKPPFIPDLEGDRDVSHFLDQHTSDQSEIGQVIDAAEFEELEEKGDWEQHLYINNFDYTSPSVT